MTTQEIVKKIFDNKKVDSIFFVACGGSLACQYPAKYMLDCEAKKLNRIGWHTSNEFVKAMPKALSKNSIAVVISYQGNTPESVEAARLAREKGASVIVLTKNPESPLAKHGEFIILYDFEKDKEDYTKAVGEIVLTIAAEVLKNADNWEKYDDFVASLARFHDITTTAREYAMEDARRYAEANAREKVMYTIGSGPAWGAAYQESICILLEMQWIHSSCIHSGEFFHGPLEITDNETSFLFFMSDGKTRALDERCLDFLKKYGRKIQLLDVKQYGINRMQDSVSEYFSGLLLNHVVGIYNEELALMRKHPLKTRRYMWKVEY